MLKVFQIISENKCDTSITSEELLAEFYIYKERWRNFHGWDLKSEFIYLKFSCIFMKIILWLWFETYIRITEFFYAYMYQNKNVFLFGIGIWMTTAEIFMHVIMNIISW